ncbi:MAG: hypothetical protein KIT87_02050 [Anaerolineae bacterium]|nr:hypothetical protein [Anaerolineae bacterium]
MSSWSRWLQGVLLALVVFLAVFYLGSAASLPPTDSPSVDTEDQTLPEASGAPQSERPVPTRRPGIQLVLGDIECEDGTVVVNFLVLRLPENVSAHSQVQYKVNGNAETATFVRQVGPVGRYVGHLNSGAGRYDVTEASIEIDGVTAQLVNPHAVEVRCRPGDERTPRPTETAGPTRTPRPTETAGPTRTPRPTEPREPTRTPRPTEPPRPTRTPEPTRTPRAAELRVDGMACEDGHLQVHFVAGRLPEGTTAAQLADTKVSYSLQIVTLGPPTMVDRQAAFRRLDSGIAHYTDTYPDSGTPQDGIYIVNRATLAIGADTLTLPFPSFPAVIRGCGTRPQPQPTERHEPTRVPTVTPTATLKP